VESRIGSWVVRAHVLSGLCIGCGAAEQERPQQTSLAESRDAQRDFQVLRQSWRDLGRAGRITLEPRLRAFLKAHPNDGRADLVRVHLALVLIDRKELDEARAILGRLREAASGSVSDFAAVAEGALLLAQGEPNAALARIEPLSGKLIDAEQKYLYGEYMVRVRLALYQWPQSVLAMRSWLTGVDASDVAIVRTSVKSYLTRFDGEKLESALTALQNSQRPSSAAAAEAHEWLQHEVVGALSQAALSERDMELAKRLIETSRTLLRDTKLRDELSALARGGELVRRIAGRRVGVVLSMKTAAARRRSAALSTGVMRGLGLPEAAVTPEAVRMAAKDDNNGMGEALAGLAAEGAGVLIAGVDADGAAKAAEFAEQAAIPVLVVDSTPVGGSAGSFAFHLAPSQETVEALLTRELESNGHSRWARVGLGQDDCARDAGGVGESHFDVALWKREHVAGLVLFGDESCSRAAARESSARGFRPALALGLEAAPLYFDDQLSNEKIALACGDYPRSDGAKPIPWFEALGRDAARLGAAAVEQFPLAVVDDARIVSKLHKEARDALSRAKVELLTTHHTGFGGAQSLPRDLRVLHSTGRARH
jgi:hypothetical protein